MGHSQSMIFGSCEPIEEPEGRWAPLFAKEKSEPDKCRKVRHPSLSVNHRIFSKGPASDVFAPTAADRFARYATQ